jgi:hypothetical protein
MKDPEKFRQHAEDCRRIAKLMPRETDKLMEIAAAWETLRGGG